MTPLPEHLDALGLRYTAAHLDDVIALATKRRWSPTQLLEHLADTEHQERTRRSLERRLTRSRLGRFTPMNDFDWAWPKRLDRAAIEAALRLDFLAEARNVLLVAAQGLGKTMIAQNIAHAAVLAGTHVLFTTAAPRLGTAQKDQASSGNFARRAGPDRGLRSAGGRRGLAAAGERAGKRREREWCSRSGQSDRPGISRGKRWAGPDRRPRSASRANAAWPGSSLDQGWSR